MRRGGWHVWMLPSLGESYEALPANMVDFAQRERRWCQGNLQHLGVLPMRGLRLVGRYHLGLGVLNYLSGPMLVGFAGLATLDGLLGGQFVARLLGTPGAGAHRLPAADFPAALCCQAMQPGCRPGGRPCRRPSSAGAPAWWSARCLSRLPPW